MKYLRKRITGFVICMLMITALLPGLVLGIHNPQQPFNPNDDNDWWPMFRHDLNHTGYSTSLAPNTADVSWNILLGDTLDCSPAVVNGVAYIGASSSACPTDHGTIYAINASNGDLLASFNVDGHVYSSPAIYEHGGIKYLYIGTENYQPSKLYCLAVQYEDIIIHPPIIIWELDFGWSVWSSPSIIDGKLYITHASGVYCLDALSGNEIWHRNDLSSDCPPTVADDKVYFGSMEAYGSFFCLNDSDDGATLWWFRTHGNVVSTPVYVDGRVFFGSNDGTVYCMDADPFDDGVDEGIPGGGSGQDFDLIWIYETNGLVCSSPAYYDGEIFIGSSDGNVYCVDAASGEEVWNFTTGDLVFSSPAIADGKLYVGSYDGHVYCLNIANGRPIWSYNPGYGWFRGSPAIGADGKLYIGTYSGMFFSFDYLPNNPPNLPNNPEPTNGETNVDIDTILSWSGGDPDTGQITTYDIYFGTTSPPPKVASNQSLTIYDPGILEYETTYYWKIVAWDGLGENSESQEWSFTTGGPQPEFEIGEITGENIGVETVIRNIGEGDAIDGEWSITFDGGIILLPLGRVKTGLFDTLAAGDELPIGAVPLGIGGFQRPLEITVAVDATNADPVNVTVQAMVFLISVIILD